MTRSSLARIFTFFLTVVCLYGNDAAWASEPTISSSKIQLPALDGFVLLAPESPGTHPVASLLVQECDTSVCAVYAGELADDNKVPASWAAVPPLFQLQVMDDGFVVETEQFVDLMQAMKADIEGLRKNVAANLAATPFGVNVLTPEGDALELIDTSAEISDDVYESDSYLALPANGSNIYKRSDGSIVSYSFDATFGFIHARDKILLLMMLGPEKDSDWGWRSFEYIVGELAHANR